MTIRFFTCHECWRDADCECRKDCGYQEGVRHECDCQYCDREYDVEPVEGTEGDCECLCHTPKPMHCARCNNTRRIPVEVLGPRQEEVA